MLFFFDCAPGGVILVLIFVLISHDIRFSVYFAFAFVSLPDVACLHVKKGKASFMK